MGLSDRPIFTPLTQSSSRTRKCDGWQKYYEVRLRCGPCSDRNRCPSASRITAGDLMGLAVYRHCSPRLMPCNGRQDEMRKENKKNGRNRRHGRPRTSPRGVCWVPNMTLSASPLAFPLHPDDLDCFIFFHFSTCARFDVERCPVGMPLLVSCVAELTVCCPTFGISWRYYLKAASLQLAAALSFSFPVILRSVILV